MSSSVLFILGGSSFDHPGYVSGNECRRVSAHFARLSAHAIHGQKHSALVYHSPGHCARAAGACVRACVLSSCGVVVVETT